jgi:mono/diheme cytochrome c family protein
MISRSRLVQLLGAGLAVVLVGCADEDPVNEAELARGEALYDMHCVQCHGGATGGHITDIPPPHNAEGHTWHHADCELKRIVLEGMPQREGFPEMPAFGDRLTEQEVDAILAHIRTWWEPDQREFQADVTDQVC